MRLQRRDLTVGGNPSNPSYSVLRVGLRAMVQVRPVRVERRLSAILAVGTLEISSILQQCPPEAAVSAPADSVRPRRIESGKQ